MITFNTLTLLAATTAITAAQSTTPAIDSGNGGSGTIEQACNPKNSSGQPDFNAPCNAIKAIEYECIYGPSVLPQIMSDSSSSTKKRRSAKNDDNDNNSSNSSSLNPQSDSTQRLCICESQFFDQVQGCSACYEKHGESVQDDSLLDPSALSSLSSSYCAASATPSNGLADFLLDWANRNNASHPATNAPTSTGTDPIGNQTDVSLYFTPSVTGSAAWVVAEATSTGTGTQSAKTDSGGVIEPTASANNEAATGDHKGKHGSSGAAAGAPTAAAVAGLAGFVGLAVLL